MTFLAWNNSCNIKFWMMIPRKINFDIIWYYVIFAAILYLSDFLSINFVNVVISIFLNEAFLHVGLSCLYICPQLIDQSHTFYYKFRGGFRILNDTLENPTDLDSYFFLNINTFKQKEICNKYCRLEAWNKWTYVWPYTKKTNEKIKSLYLLHAYEI